MHKKYCENCNRYFTKGEKYCTSCGSKLIENVENENLDNKKVNEISNEKKTISDFDEFVSIFLLPIAGGMGIIELFLFWTGIQIGIPRAIDGKATTLFLIMILDFCLKRVRKVIIRLYAGSPKLNLFGLKKSIFLNIEKFLKLAYTGINIVCICGLISLFWDEREVLESLFELREYFMIWTMSLEIIYELKTLYFWDEVLELLRDISMITHPVTKESLEKDLIEEKFGD